MLWNILSREKHLIAVLYFKYEDCSFLKTKCRNRLCDDIYVYNLDSLLFLVFDFSRYIIDLYTQKGMCTCVTCSFVCYVLLKGQWTEHNILVQFCTCILCKTLPAERQTSIPTQGIIIFNKRFVRNEWMLYTSALKLYTPCFVIEAFSVFKKHWRQFSKLKTNL